MKKSTIICLVILFSLFTPILSIIPVKGITFTYTQYWFYIDQPGVIDYKDMQFTVKNNQPNPREIVCTYQKVEGIDIDVIFDWTRINLTVGETAINKYKINVTGELSVIFNLKIFLHEKPLGSSDSQLLSGGIMINKVVFYSSTAGSLLTLKITDQAERPREAEVTIKYSLNDSMPYTPIKEFNGSQFYGVLPYGDYRVYAYDIGEPTIYAEQDFVLNDTEHNMTVKLDLVGFGIFKLIPRGTVGVETTIFNHVGELESVKIYAELYYDDTHELLEATNPIKISPLPKSVNQKITMWFQYLDWTPNRKYIVRGVIEAGELPIAYRWSEKFDIIPTEEENKPLITIEGIIGVVFITGIIIYAFGMTIFGIKNYLDKQKLRAQTDEKSQN